MELTADYDDSVEARIRREPEFARLVFERVLQLMVNGEPEVARLMLRNLINATLGFEQLARQVEKNPKALHRMVSARGNPTMDNLSGILHALRETIAPKPRRRKPARAAVYR